VGKTQGSDETFQYVVRYLLNHYQKSNIMGMDEVFVHMAEKYYLSGKADWVDSTTLAKMRDRVSKIKPNIIGKKAPELKVINTSGEHTSLHDVESKYTLVYFWEPTCSHCKKLTPKIYDLYQDYSRDQLEVFAVYTQTDRQEWLKYLNNKGLDWINTYDPKYLSNFRQKYDVYSTPTVYLLDKDKTIVAKRLGFESLKKMLEQKIGN
jgi:thiol-disulfide isomerase/thioredoxin